MPVIPLVPLTSCAGCGACCYSWSIPIGEHDFDQHGTPAELTKTSLLGGLVMRQVDGACVALDRETERCTIYERRPQVCRDFELGSYGCMRAAIREGRMGERA